MTSNSSRDIIVHVFGRTDVGRTREHNEDCFVVADLTTMNATLQPEVREHRPGPRGSLFMVADGMGGAAAGEIASQMAVEVVLEDLDARWRKSASTDADAFVTALRAAVELVNTRIHRFAMEHPEYRGMGTTTTIAGILGDMLYLCQVGDSRGYLVRGGVARQITKDQSLVQRLIDAGELTPEEAEVSERRNIILQALGPEPMVKVDVTMQQLCRGDTLLLCSDGLSGLVRTDDISRIVSEAPDLVSACKSLIDLANENGGPDNITVITARFEGGGLQPPAAHDDVGHRVYVSPSETRPTMPVDAGMVQASIEALDALDLSMATTTEVDAARGPAEDAPGGVGLRDTKPVAALPPLAATQRMSVTQVRVIFGTITVAVGAWLAWLYLLRN